MVHLLNQWCLGLTFLCFVASQRRHESDVVQQWQCQLILIQNGVSVEFCQALAFPQQHLRVIGHFHKVVEEGFLHLSLQDRAIKF